MLVTLKEILKIAEEKKCAIGSFNTPNPESLEAVIGAAEELKQPVIIMLAQVHEEMGICKMSEIGPRMLTAARLSRVPVCVHIDHGTSLDYINKALEYGFTSVMYDGSELSPRDNIANTIKAVRMAEQYGASVEGEIGSMGARESGAGGGESVYTEPIEAKAFAETGIDAIACAFGTAHGIYLTEPKLDFDRLEEIKKVVNIPIVMHGGSGVSHEDYRRVIDIGVRKINYYSYMAKAGATAVKNMKDATYFHDISVVATKAMKDDVKAAITVFAGLDR